MGQKSVQSRRHECAHLGRELAIFGLKYIARMEFKLVSCGLKCVFSAANMDRKLAHTGNGVNIYVVKYDRQGQSGQAITLFRLHDFSGYSTHD